MFEQKAQMVTDGSASGDGVPQAKRKKVTTKPVENWKVKNDRALNISIWLTYNKIDCGHMESLKMCSVH